jgi:predicted MFS family arabinose efflux permease
MPPDVSAVAGRTRVLPAGYLIAAVVVAQGFVQIGAFFWPALLPGLIPSWNLSNSEAGWITSVFYAGYMVSVPVLVTLTDRIEAKLVYLFGVGCTIVAHLSFAVFVDGFWSALAARTLTGIGWAGTYMTGLKMLADQVEPKMMSRAVTAHAASIGISGALSFSAAGVIAGEWGWRAAFLAAAASAALAWLLVAVAFARGRRPAPKPAKGQSLFDFRAVLSNKSVMAYALAYCVHTLEMNALRGWAVAFLGYVAGATAASASVLSPTFVATSLGLIGTAASVGGNELAIRFGRRWLITLAMVASIAIACAIGAVGTTSYSLAAGLLMAYGLVVWLDSSSLTAGTAGNAEPSRRGATLAVHSMLGYAGGFVGPLLIGWTLDLSGGMSPLGWGASFVVIAVLVLVSLVVFRLIRPRELAGDKGEEA